MTTTKVVTVTLNPALDLTGHMPNLKLGHVNLADSGSIRAAGKGVNVAKVLSELGAQVTVTGFLGKDNPTLFTQLFDDINAKDAFVRVEGATRINVKLVENEGRISDINFPGVEVTDSDITRFEETLFTLAQEHEYFVIAGSLPSGVSPKLCASWIERLHQLGKKVLFDSSRAALSEGLQAKPWLIKPNDEELAEFVQRELTTPEECQNAALELADKGIDNIVVSMGEQGVMWLNQDQWLFSQPPKVNVISTVGAGDTLVAGLCWGHMQEMEKTTLLQFATGLSAIAVTQVGVGIPSQQQLNNMIEQVSVRQINVQQTLTLK
ncbi:1-phosphofructokinase [Vibrio sp. UCD-FRSSP16_10]|uniref:1-phosphofructokinase n=1 Tax=unclassified Vibrio TaxID=2614977 RepID=UPI0007FD7436|nr:MULTISPECIES: 1-phosphofructokinase [unclassified Vibrio]OBT09456.1 1-phosphofructokinase [Vibrio sp. UCD-FRSSP16_30]OBT22135.1 1-phosphofructokinase [Vibrio sp. UCD-FRSSP16_10]